MLVMMAGLPGTGKSTLARQLAARLPALLLDKDTLRAKMFPPRQVAYTSEQDDTVVSKMLEMTKAWLSEEAGRVAILDGRPFSRRTQVEAVAGFAEQQGFRLRIIECVCPPEVALSRLEADRKAGSHPATNRDEVLYRRLRALWEPIAHPHLVVDTTAPVETSVERCLAYLAGAGDGSGAVGEAD